MRITILTQYYPPEHGAPQNRLHDLAKRWTQAGEQVTVLTAMPNYPAGEVFKDYRGRFSGAEEIDGVKVVRAWMLPSRKKGTIPQLRAYFSFVFAALLVGAFRLGRADFLVCESPPLFLGFTALVLAFLKRSRLVMNISDLWPESAVQLGMLGPGPALRCLEWFEGLLYRRSALVSCQTEGIVDGVKKRHPRASTLLFPNGVDPETFFPIPKDLDLARRLGLPEGGFVVGYGGNHGRSQALSQVLDAAALLQDEDVRFVLFGDGPEKDELVAKAKARGLDKVHFFPSMPRLEMLKAISLWDVALVPLRDIELFHGARPSKMFELMAAEKPFVFCGEGEGADLALSSGCAVAVPAEHPPELAAAIMALRRQSPEELRAMGAAGHAFVLRDYNRVALAAAFLERLRALAT